VRRVRMLGLCLVALFAMSATTLVVASPALAGGCNVECKEQKEKEKQEAKEKKQKEKEEAKKHKEQEKAEKKRKKEEESIFSYEKFNRCPLSNPEAQACIYGEAGPESFFQAGKVTVHFVKPIILKGGAAEIYEFNGVGEIIGSKTTWLEAENGQTISKEAEPAPPLTEDIDAEALAGSEKTRYEEYLASGGSTKTTATIELVTRPATTLPASEIYLNESNLLREEGEAFGFPVQVHLENKFLGAHCYVGNNSYPIEVAFTTGATSPPPPNTPIHGLAAEYSRSNYEGTILQLKGTRLVNNSYAAPGVEGCGINGGADSALDGGLELPSPAGSNTTELVGDLYQDGAEVTREHIKY
jgi:hypothetical protein